MDTTDDWMNPRTSLSYTPPPPKNGTFYVIQRKKATPVSGNVSAIYSWDNYEEFDTQEARDKKLAMLRDEHPMWHLRARTQRWVNDRLMNADPFEYQDA